MAFKGRVITSLVLRIFTILFAAGCIVVFILDKATDPGDGSKVTFKDVIAYRYVLATAVIAAAYCTVQLPCTIYYACTEKKLIPGAFLPVFYFFGDKVVAFILASGVSAGFTVTFELKRFLDHLLKSFGSDLKDTPFEGYFNRGYIATGILAGAFLCMAFLSIFSSPPRSIAAVDNRTAGKRGFFFR